MKQIIPMNIQEQQQLVDALAGQIQTTALRVVASYILSQFGKLEIL